MRARLMPAPLAVPAVRAPSARLPMRPLLLAAALAAAAPAAQAQTRLACTVETACTQAGCAAPPQPQVLAVSVTDTAAEVNFGGSTADVLPRLAVTTYEGLYVFAGHHRRGVIVLSLRADGIATISIHTPARGTDANGSMQIFARCQEPA